MGSAVCRPRPRRPRPLHRHQRTATIRTRRTATTRTRRTPTIRLRRRRRRFWWLTLRTSIHRTSTCLPTAQPATGTRGTTVVQAGGHLPQIPICMPAATVPAAAIATTSTSNARCVVIVEDLPVRRHPRPRRLRLRRLRHTAFSASTCSPLRRVFPMQPLGIARRLR